MPSEATRAVISFLQNLNPDLTDSVMESIREGKKAGIPKELLPQVKLVLSEMSTQQKQLIKVLLAEGKIEAAQDSARAALGGSLQKIEAQTEAVNARKIEDTTQRIRASEASRTGRLETSLLEKEQGPVASARGAQAKTVFERSILGESLQPELAALRSEVNAKTIPGGTAELRTRLEAFKSKAAGVPGISAETSTLVTQLDTRVADAVAKTEGKLDTAGRGGRRLEGEFRQEPIKLAQTTGNPLSLRSKSGKEALRLARGQQSMSEMTTRRLQQAGLEFSSGSLTRKSSGLLGRLPFLGGAGIKDAETGLSQVLSLQKEALQLQGAGAEGGAAGQPSRLVGDAGKLGQARSGLRSAIQTATKGPGKLLGKGAAIGIPLLLLSLLRGKGGQDQNPMQQIQMLQLMAQQQQQQDLVNSKVQSQGASSQANMARAQLLRVKALLAAGAGGQAGVL